MVETRAELPFIGDQVGLYRAQPGQPTWTCRVDRTAKAFYLTVHAFLSRHHSDRRRIDCGLLPLPSPGSWANRAFRSGLGVPIEMVYLDLGGTVVELISCLLYVRNRETLAELPPYREPGRSV